jgi:hypothetical protein
MTDNELKTGMTEKEADALDEYFISHPVEFGVNLLKQGLQPGSIHKQIRVFDLDTDVLEYLNKKAALTHQSQAHIASEMLRHEMAYA